MVSHEVDDVCRHVTVCRALDAGRLVERQVDPRWPCDGRTAIHLYLVAQTYLCAERRGDAIDGDPARCDPVVGLPARADASFAQVLVQAHRRGVPTLRIPAMIRPMAAQRSGC